MTLSILNMVIVSHKMVRLDRVLDYRGFTIFNTQITSRNQNSVLLLKSVGI